MNNLARAALDRYQITDNSSIVYADPHALILKLMDGAMERICQAKGAIQHGNNETKGKFIGKAIGIIAGLDGCLQRDPENSLSNNLEAIYEYMNMRLLEANVENDVSKLDEVARLMGEIRAGWMQIPDEARQSHARENVGSK